MPDRPPRPLALIRLELETAEAARDAAAGRPLADAHVVEMRRANEAEILPDVVRQAIAELDVEHQPQWASPEAKAAGKDPIGCDLCWPGDGSWPCITRLIVDDLRAAVSGSARDAAEGRRRG